MKEADIMRSIQIAATEIGWRLFRNNTGSLKDRDGRYVTFGLCVGSSDLIGWSNTGLFVAVEVKTTTGRATPEQLAFLRAVEISGGLAFLCRSVDEFKTKAAALTAACRGKDTTR